MNEIDRHADRTRETADYIATLAHELSELADTTDLAVLRYLLEMARDEARAAARRAEPGGRDD
ncbi:hypothetical protein [Ancylobacter mangrovi]|uniref:hypothetical protein n=1 Tax=Ancylobacter mangrovi TaxID=2972472 RepID=UPI0021622E4F|nr:hypothetical protein [Ancylobacter mangrovi]MCS0505267.1 hypothetical protein [Ancylobacter mangrovi]